MTKPRLLVVDDDEDIRVQMKWALGSDYEGPMAAKYGGRTIDGLAKKLGDGTVHVVTLK
jgi:hypothetical protein